MMEEISDFKKIQERLNTQDNRMTADPIFIVYDWEEVPSLEDYTDDFKYRHYDGDDLGTTKQEVIDFCKGEEWDLPNNINDMSDWAFDDWVNDHPDMDKVYYIKKRRFVGVFFTEKAAQTHIDANHYHYKEPHIYVESLWRNPEMQAVRKALMDGRVKE